MSDHWLQTSFKWAFAALVSAWLTIPAAVQLLVVLSGFDLLSCLFTHRSGLRETLRRVAVMLLLCGAIHVVYQMARGMTGFNLGFDVGTAVVLFYVLGEIIEITLNCSTVIPIPPKLIEFLEKAQGLTGSQKKAIDTLKDDKSPHYDAL